MERAAFAALFALVSVACTASPQTAATPTAPAAASSQPAMPSVGPAEVHPVSIEALMAKRFDGRALRIRRDLGGDEASTRHLVTYRSGSLSISGLLVVPRGDGPFPVLVLAHGYIDPAVYRTGRGFERSQSFLVRRGFVVLHVDYRNHATSDDDPRNDERLRLGYVEDVINAARAVKRSDLPFLDTARVGLLGRSMGGGVAWAVAVVRPALVDAIVVFAPTSADAVDNFERWIRRPDRRALAQRIIRRYGEPSENPGFWRAASPASFLERVAVPIQVHHGTDDESVPIRWTRRTVEALRRLGKQVVYHEYPGEGHAFGPAYARSMERSVRFFRRHL